MSRITLASVFKDVAKQNPRAAAITFLDAHLRPTQYNYQSLFGRTAEISSALRRRVPATVLPVGILLKSQEAQVLHYLATLSAGHVPAILTPPNRKMNLDYYIDNLKVVLERCKFSALITDIDPHGLPGTILEPYTLLEVQHGPSVQVQDLNDAALLQFSSGTTGSKRGVLVTNAAVLAQLETYSRVLSLEKRDCIISWLPLYHDMGLMACLNMPLAFGNHCVMLEPLDWVANPISYLRAASDYSATLGWNPNFAYAFMADRALPSNIADLDLSSLRALVNCSEPVTWESQRRFIDRFGRCNLRSDIFKGCYAMAETTFALTHCSIGDEGTLDYLGPEPLQSFPGARPLVSAGRPLPGVEIQIADNDGTILPDRRLGEILVRSPFNFPGYYNDEAGTSQVFRNGWYWTGDRGYRAEDNIFVCGRTKDMLIVGGINIFPQDIEDLCSSIEGLRAGRVVAFSEFDEKLQTERIVVLAETGVSVEKNGSLRVRLRQQILSAFQISNFEVHLVEPEWLIKSSSGKMARRLNQERWRKRLKDRIGSQ